MLVTIRLKIIIQYTYASLTGNLCMNNLNDQLSCELELDKLKDLEHNQSTCRERGCCCSLW